LKGEGGTVGLKGGVGQKGCERVRGLLQRDDRDEP